MLSPKDLTMVDHAKDWLLTLSISSAACSVIFSPGLRYKPGLKGAMPFSPGSCLKPGLKGSFEPGLMPLAARTGTNAHISSGS